MSVLPTHRSSPAVESLSRLSKGHNPFSRVITRWLILGCSVLAVFWFAGPLVREMMRAPPAQLDYYPPAPETTSNPPILSDPSKVENQEPWEAKKEEVRVAFKHAWTGYKTKSFPHDELLSVSGGTSDKFNGWGVTLFDSLDTMWIMGLKEEFTDAVDSIQNIRFVSTKKDHYVPFFETVIRYLGGILSAYALSGDKTLFRLADEMGHVLLPAFRVSESGLPAYSVHAESGKSRPDDFRPTILFAEAASCQLEFKYLAKITGNKEYYQRVQKVADVFYKANATDGLFADTWNINDGKPTGAHFTIGATTDSGYEYLIKQYLQNGDEQAKAQYLKSAAGIIDKLIYITPNRGLMYVGDFDHGRFVHRLEHLSCFLPGMFALGVATLDLPPDVRELHQWVAAGITHTCYLSYADQQSGLAPEQINMNHGHRWIDEVNKWKENGRIGKPPGLSEPKVEPLAENRDYSNGWPDGYLLRPETVESIFLMWRITGDVKWRERGYTIFQAIVKQTRTELGFASVHNINVDHTTKVDDMPSYFLAETLKYLYLLFDDTHSITFNHWVFNTEAHPLPVFTWTEAEKQAFNIPS